MWYVGEDTVPEIYTEAIRQGTYPDGYIIQKRWAQVWSSNIGLIDADIGP